MTSERCVLGKLVARYVGTARGVFELADGRRGEVDGVVPFDSAESPGIGEKRSLVNRWIPTP
jgi:hypothetical protein